MIHRRNKNRGYQQLRVWQDAVDENGLMKLIESLERKRDDGDWRDSFAQERDREIGS